MALIPNVHYISEIIGKGRRHAWLETEPGIGEFNFLEENVRMLGAIEAKVVPASVIVVVKRMAEKCRIIRKVFSTTMMQVGSENME